MTKAPQKSQPITVATILESGERLFESQGLFYGHGTTNAWDEAVYLLTFVLDLPPDADRSVLSKVLTAQQQSPLSSLPNKIETFLSDVTWLLISKDPSSA